MKYRDLLYGIEEVEDLKRRMESRVISIQSIAVILQNKYCEKGFPGGLAKVACLCCFRELDFQAFPQKADFLATLVRFLSALVSLFLHGSQT